MSARVAEQVFDSNTTADVPHSILERCRLGCGLTRKDVNCFRGVWIVREIPLFCADTLKQGAWSRIMTAIKRWRAKTVTVTNVLRLIDKAHYSGQVLALTLPTVSLAHTGRWCRHPSLI